MTAAGHVEGIEGASVRAVWPHHGVGGITSWLTSHFLDRSALPQPVGKEDGPQYRCWERVSGGVGRAVSSFYGLTVNAADTSEPVSPTWASWRLSFLLLLTRFRLHGTHIRVSRSTCPFGSSLMHQNLYGYMHHPCCTWIKIELIN